MTINWTTQTELLSSQHSGISDLNDDSTEVLEEDLVEHHSSLIDCESLDFIELIQLGKFVDSRIEVDSKNTSLNPNWSGDGNEIEYMNDLSLKSLTGTQKNEKIIKRSSKRIAGWMSLKNLVNLSDQRKLKMKSQKHQNSIK